MKYTFNVSPNLRQSQSTKRIMLELTIALLGVYAFSLFYYQMEEGSEYTVQALILMATSLIVAFVTETIWALCKKQNVKTYLSTSFGWTTAMILTLMCPISITPYALGIATFFAICRQNSIWRIWTEYLQSGCFWTRCIVCQFCRCDNGYSDKRNTDDDYGKRI